MSFSEMIEYIKEYTNNFNTGGIIKFIVDILLVLGVLGFVAFAIRKKIRIYKVLIIFACFFAAYMATSLLGLDMFAGILQFVGYFAILIIIIIYNQDIRHTLDSFLTTKKNDNSYSTQEEKDLVISIICDTAEYLAKRKIGALISFEREDSLSNITDKAIKIDSIVTQELLTTIFSVGTPCHDGCVIIRSNRIACAGAYYPSTENFDIPKFLGTRHRAAIGISEKSDAITVVVSE